MNDRTSRDTAWGVVEQLWRQERDEDDNPAIRKVTTDRLRTLFDMFWQAMYDNDRSEVRRTAEEYIDLLITNGGDDAD